MNKLIYNVILLLGIMPCVVIAMDAPKKQLGLPGKKLSTQRKKLSAQTTQSSTQATKPLHKKSSLSTPLLEEAKPTSLLEEAKKELEKINQSYATARAISCKNINITPTVLRHFERKEEDEIVYKFAFDESIKNGILQNTVTLLTNSPELREKDLLAGKLYAVLTNKVSWLEISSFSETESVPLEDISKTARSLARYGGNEEFIKRYDRIKKENLERQRVFD
jgi:hypothetical protein